MACGVPVVGSSSAEIPNVIHDAGLVVQEGDPVALRAAIGRVLSDAELRQDMARHGRQSVLARYTHRRIAEQTVAAYRAAVGASGAAIV
jgi:glycosyltransferase involved in cell wall biosynthesis